jgi:hypothetical protein
MFWNEEPITQMDVSNLRNRPNEWKKDDIARREGKKSRTKQTSRKKKAFIKANPRYNTVPEFEKNILGATSGSPETD